MAGAGVGSGVAVGRESPWDSIGAAVGVGVPVGSRVTATAVGGRWSAVGIVVGVAVLKRTSLTGVGSRLGSDWAEK